MKPNPIVTEYVKRVSEDALTELRMRFRQDLAGDKAAVCDILSQDKEIDRWLAKASDSAEFFEMLDQVGEAVMREYGRRDSSQDSRENRRPKK